MNYWLIKSEAACYSIDDLKIDGETSWTGIRNYQARNFIKSMKKGDLCFFYHSSSNLTGIYGITKVDSDPYPDPTAQNKKNEHYDPKATKENPIWFAVKMKFLKKFNNHLSLPRLRIDPVLNGMLVLKKGMRLSVMPVSEAHYKHVVSISK